LHGVSGLKFTASMQPLTYQSLRWELIGCLGTG
jgi:hypothetical protein